MMNINVKFKLQLKLMLLTTDSNEKDLMFSKSNNKKIMIHKKLLGKPLIRFCIDIK